MLLLTSSDGGDNCDDEGDWCYSDCHNGRDREWSGWNSEVGWY